jgi:UDP-glucose 4-epimerase
MGMKKNNKILITGSSGTIGTRLFEKLLAENYDVIGFDRKHNKWSNNLNKLTIIGDLLKKEDIKKNPTDIDIVVHLAANIKVYDSVLNPDSALENIISTYNILDFCRRKNIKNIIFSSSRESYGNRKKIIAKEKDVDINLCESPYAASKISDEVLMHSFSKCYKINHIIFRFSNVYGMYDESDRFVPLMIRTMKANDNVTIFGKDKFLDFTYIDDCIEGVIKCIENFSKVKNNVFNIASGKSSNLIDVAKIIKRNLNSKSQILIGKSRQGEVIKYIADISKAKKMFGYNPVTSLEEGVRLSINWYKNNQ